MKIRGSILFLLITSSLFGQETIDKIRLLPIELLETKMDKELREAEADYKEQAINDSLNSSSECIKSWEKYKTLISMAENSLIELESSVHELNETNKNSGYYYYLVRDCKSNKFDFTGCGEFILRYSCLEYDLRIEKKEKSRLILDGPIGEIFYYEDVNRTPR